jgi:predicted MPP superfamily phosphohydrolase
VIGLQNGFRESLNHKNQRTESPLHFPKSKRRGKLTRRQWLKRVGLTLVATGAAVGVYTHWIEPFWVDFVGRDLPIANLPSQWHGRTVVQISDIHIGHRVSDDFLTDTFTHVADLEPDVVAFTGDFITLTRGAAPPYDQVKRVLDRFPQGKLATLGVLGNHDYGHGWSEANVASRLVEVAYDRGMRVLRNEAVAVDELEFIGLDDLMAERCNVAAGLAASNGVARIVLCHNPDAADEPSWDDYEGWILAGHTHGGQCKPPFLPPPLLPVKNKRYTAGEFDLFDGRTMYINRGLGHLRRVRFNVRPEITTFRLVAA